MRSRASFRKRCNLRANPFLFLSSSRFVRDVDRKEIAQPIPTKKRETAGEIKG